MSRQTATMPKNRNTNSSPSPSYAVGSRSARIEHAGEDRGGANEQQFPTRDGDQVDAGEHRDAERHVGGDQHLLWRHEAARGDAHRTEPILRVGSPSGVGVVVRQVGTDLDEDRDDHRRDEAQGVEHAGEPGQRRCRRAPARPTRAASAAAPPSARCASRSDCRRPCSRAPGELREVRSALLEVGAAPLGRLLAHVEEEVGVVGELLDPGETVLVGVEAAFRKRSANGESASISRHQLTVSSSS